MRRRAAFTLLESLVVAVVLSVLAGIAASVVSIGRSSAQNAVCVANLRNLGASVHLYAADYDDRMPFAVDRWVQDAVLHNGYSPPLRDLIAVATPFDRAVSAYRGVEAAACPFDRAHPRARRGDEAATSYFEANGISYAYNAEDGLRARSMSSFARPARAPLLADYDCFHRPEDDPRVARVNLLATDGNVRAVTCYERVMRDLNRDF